MPIKRILIENLFDGEDYHNHQVMIIENGCIIGFDNNTDDVTEHLQGTVVPGFVDIQVNGGGGVLFNSTPSLLGIRNIINAHVKYGTTAILPTLITDRIEVMAQAADAVAQAIIDNEPGIIGIHFEGPHLSVTKKGAHSECYIREITEQEWQILTRKDIGKVVVTLAPETVAAKDIQRMVDVGIVVCLGHTNASFAQTQEALAHGATGFTHLFNAMSPIQGRELGVTGCALLHEHAACGLIVDGHHVSYPACQLALKSKAKGQIFLVTDAMPPVATSAQEFAFFDRSVQLHEGKLTSTTGELAGSVLDMITAVKNTYKYLNQPLEEALRMASCYPAKFIHANLHGALTVGKQADFVVLDKNLTVVSTWIKGLCYWQHH